MSALFEMLSERLNSNDPVLSYASIGSEVSTSKLNQWLLDSGRLILPKVTDQGLKIYRVLKSSDLEKGAFQIMEPKSSCKEISLEEVPFALLPGLAFDTKGVRLGYGKGHYDALLAAFSGLKIGIAYVEQKSLDPLPREGWDILMDEVLWL